MFIIWLPLWGLEKNAEQAILQSFDKRQNMKVLNGSRK